MPINHVDTYPHRCLAHRHFGCLPRGCLPRVVCDLHPASNQEPTAHQRAAYRDKRREVGDPETELACWLLEALAKESEGDFVKGLMHQRSTMETLARYACFVAASRRIRGMVSLDACAGATCVCTGLVLHVFFRCQVQWSVRINSKPSFRSVSHQVPRGCRQQGQDLGGAPPDFASAERLPAQGARSKTYV